LGETAKVYATCKVFGNLKHEEGKRLYADPHTDLNIKRKKETKTQKNPFQGSNDQHEADLEKYIIKGRRPS